MSHHFIKPFVQRNFQCSKCRDTGRVLVDVAYNGRTVGFLDACDCPQGTPYRGRIIDVEGHQYTSDLALAEASAEASEPEPEWAPNPSTRQSIHDFRIGGLCASESN
jgi:hypothetical protein